MSRLEEIAAKWFPCRCGMDEAKYLGLDSRSHAPGCPALLRAECQMAIRAAQAEERERCEQICRYVLKHQNFSDDDGEYASGFEAACEITEQAIRSQQTS